jgi:hypothetical protein
MYEYKAFFSYKRHPLTDEWHTELMVRIQFWLSQELAIQDVPIFFDTRSISNGLVFDQVICDALRKSTVIISVMSPLYFTSAYCLAEIGTFIEREDHLRKNRGSLISCARFHDGASYPLPFSHMQSEDFAEFANPANAFWNSPAGVAFQPRIRCCSPCCRRAKPRRRRGAARAEPTRRNGRAPLPGRRPRIRPLPFAGSSAFASPGRADAGRGREVDRQRGCAVVQIWKVRACRRLGS